MQIEQARNIAKLPNGRKNRLLLSKIEADEDSQG